MNFGGPVWHASVSYPGRFPGSLLDDARRELAGVGDATRGEWVEQREIRKDSPMLRAWVVHVRRRLTAEEEAIIGPPVDIRGTAEFERRSEIIRRWASPLMVAQFGEIS